MKSKHSWKYGAISCADVSRRGMVLHVKGVFVGYLWSVSSWARFKIWVMPFCDTDVCVIAAKPQRKRWSFISATWPTASFCKDKNMHLYIVTRRRKRNEINICLTESSHYSTWMYIINKLHCTPWRLKQTFVQFLNTKKKMKILPTILIQRQIEIPHIRLETIIVKYTSYTAGSQTISLKYWCIFNNHVLSDKIL